MTASEDKTVCPKCGGEFEAKEAGEDLKVEQCHQCFGLLVLAGVTRKLLANWGPDTMVDTGSNAWSTAGIHTSTNCPIIPRSSCSRIWQWYM